MKKLKIILIFTLLATFCVANAQDFTVSNGTERVMIYNAKDDINHLYSGIDYLVVFAKIMPQAEIMYTGNGSSFDWYEFGNPAVPISNQPYISPQAATGYILKIDGSRTLSLWVIDYSEVQQQIDDIIIDESFTDVCNFTKLNLQGNLMPLWYQTPEGVTHQIGRELTVRYATQRWGSDSWLTVDTVVTETVYENSIEVPAPLTNTNFDVQVSDRFANDFGISVFSGQSATYQAFAVRNKLLTSTLTRDAENEDQRPDNPIFLEGSAPLDIHFIANPSAAVTHNQWNVFKENQFFFVRNEADFNYSFSEYGRYKVALVSSNEQCSYSDSVVVDISESILEAPNVFTPNGDGVNDEFRVAYRSLRSFQMAVYNRWGNKIYTSNDPQHGWNGNIGNREAAAGPYFYYIKAEGTDGKKYVKKGDINLIR
ncbi:MAG: gliding motility-associated C-terminal domain-containing protein [Prevotellaceae bacterium]|jgi:gliding motility-associated-like protein|nr:gliding motility-associated C-terminal domain-containing protein [Prevotellaceae bacterium]